MRTTLLSAGLASLVALAGAGACGGGVVVDGSPGGDEGSGGASATAGAASGPAAPSSAGAGPVTTTAVAGPQSSSAGGADPVEAQMASCGAFCALFDRACPSNGCRDACAELITAPRPCNALTAPYFDCMSAGIQISSMTSCEQIARWLDPLFECLGSSASTCETSFKDVCSEAFKDHRACQLDGAP
ncbi:hypothetical protein WME76_47405 (plasmid) [Sorangium sp. So ce119]|uniref:hypothetical protein n=1 Tax=Sorangium sp. So ce119 TaxID=3133279 RepID=UPI003F620CA5